MQPDKKIDVQYRIQPQRVFDITNQFSNRAVRAKTLAILRSCLFGRKRYQNIYLNCSLNNLFNALRIASLLNDKVAGLAMIIKFVPFKIIQMQADNHSNVIQRNKIQIKLTYHPSEQDKLQPGFNPGKPKEQIQNPIQGLQVRRNDNPRNQNQQRRGGYNRRGGNRNQYNDRNNDRYNDRNNYRNNNNQNKRTYRHGRNQRPQEQDQREQRYQRQQRIQVPKQRGGNFKSRGGHQQSNQRHNEQNQQIRGHNYKNEHLNN